MTLPEKDTGLKTGRHKRENKRTQEEGPQEGTASEGRSYKGKYSGTDENVCATKSDVTSAEEAPGTPGQKRRVGQPRFLLAEIGGT